MQATEVNSPPVGLRADERPGGWLFFPRSAPLDPRTQAIYQQMLEHLQRDMLVLLVALGWDAEHSPWHAVVRDYALVAFGFEEL